MKVFSIDANTLLQRASHALHPHAQPCTDLGHASRRGHAGMVESLPNQPTKASTMAKAAGQCGACGDAAQVPCRYTCPDTRTVCSRMMP